MSDLAWLVDLDVMKLREAHLDRMHELERWFSATQFRERELRDVDFARQQAEMQYYRENEEALVRMMLRWAERPSGIGFQGGSREWAEKQARYIWHLGI